MLWMLWPLWPLWLLSLSEDAGAVCRALRHTACKGISLWGDGRDTLKLDGHLHL